LSSSSEPGSAEAQRIGTQSAGAASAARANRNSIYTDFRRAAAVEFTSR
jgi:hypothetical protein